MSGSSMINRNLWPAIALGLSRDGIPLETYRPGPETILIESSPYDRPPGPRRLRLTKATINDAARKKKRRAQRAARKITRMAGKR